MMFNGHVTLVTIGEARYWALAQNHQALGWALDIIRTLQKGESLTDADEETLKKCSAYFRRFFRGGDIAEQADEEHAATAACLAVWRELSAVARGASAVAVNVTLPPPIKTERITTVERDEQQLIRSTRTHDVPLPEST